MLSQSVPVTHSLVATHAAQVPPPQSTSVSTPFLTASSQAGAWQVPLVQTPLWQSPFTVQVLSVGQRAHELVPPQSASLSPPFFELSLQLAGEHKPLVQTAL
jgi:hypothetical protein